MIGLIYEITNKDRSIVYVGSTLQTIERRWNHHKSNFKRWCEGKDTACSIYHHFKELGIDHFQISVIKEYEVKSADELRQYEHLVIGKRNCVNTQRLSTDERYLARRDKLNKKIDCPCGGRYAVKNKCLHARTNIHKTWLSAQ
ncbi:TPA: hypothetical protein N0F65_009890 [Lagenidium giganteum]|uniref:GIY-YIG domain-containing protein n=1 Tax=Lagenidium giganteum TaxID=4803 RepID=A0AAV2YY20_9STRA|nr:TPA: hypothetical protein N0F65_009869 [Lagenidium giganteum]DAZ97439.1 TPA: hypothetical protein N0F65_009890 [Lagenidium giganteum]